ncbi:HTH domain-containing protein [Neobacillus niacini]|uniref:HTH domain-containing protein n=1 Tax=Neobacillus niacini TaxID=86668 RepID=UPI002856E133|nr:HTH domain-containing protein [Neobacillus niacini]MDR6998778.1 hypothetical protein [Neobacillus niacini]
MVVISIVSEKTRPETSFLYLINKILYKNETVYPYHPLEISSFLAHIDDIDDTRRICSIIDSLHRIIGISYETLAVFGEVETTDLEELLRNPDSLTEKKKFVLAVRLMYLYFVLKEKYTVDTNSD